MTKAPHALTRFKIGYFHGESEPGMIVDEHGDYVLFGHAQGLRQALAQQAQEVERYLDRIKELKGHRDKAQDNLEQTQQQLAAMTAERDAFKAVLQGAEYEQIDKIGTLSVEVAQRIGVAAAHRTKEIIAQLAASQQKVRELENAMPSMYPIMGGPSVPWEVMRPHESWAQKNHSQSLQQLANRGGLSPGEAWCIVNGIHCGIASKAQWTLWDAEWFKYAERVNLHYDQLATLQATLAEREARIAELEQAAQRSAILGAAVSDEAGWETAKRFEALYDTARQDAARLREALEAHMQLAAKICYAEPELSQYRAMTEQAHRALKGEAPLTASRPDCATAEQVEQYIKMADMELGPECVDAWVEDIRQFLRTQYHTR